MHVALVADVRYVTLLHGYTVVHVRCPHTGRELRSEEDSTDAKV